MKNQLSHLMRGKARGVLCVTGLQFLVVTPLMALPLDSSPRTGENSMQTEIPKTNETAQSTANRQAQNPETKPLPFEAPYPFTAEELWQKILKVVELPEGYVTRQQVESIFDVRLQKVNFPKDGPNSQNFSTFAAIRGGNWYFDLVFSEHGPGMSSFQFNWGGAQQWAPREIVPYDSLPLPPPSMCLLPDQLMPDVEQRGWIFKPGLDDIHHSPLGSKNYIKGKMGVLSLLFFRQELCLHSVVIYATSDRIE